MTLPSFDDFRRRDETQGAVPERRRTPPGEQTAQEKLFELLTFDTIDDRAERSDEMEYDMTARLIGRGTASKGGAYLLPYFQTGHILLLGVLLLSATVSYPGDAAPAPRRGACPHPARASRRGGALWPSAALSPPCADGRLSADRSAGRVP